MDNVFIYGLYILIWPAITLGVLILICTATYRDIKKAQYNNKDIVQHTVLDDVFYKAIMQQRLSDGFTQSNNTSNQR